MINATSNKRVVITNVLPSVEAGQYPAKAIINHPIMISADIFCDGHDELNASVLVKHKQEKKWKEATLKLVGNDSWQLSFVPDKIGVYQFRVQAWVDHFETWRRGLLKRYHAKQDISLDLKIGAEIVKNDGAFVEKKYARTLQQWGERLQNAKGDHEAMEIATSEEMSAIFCKCYNKDTITLHPHTFEIEVDREKAMFSTWYELFPRSASMQPGKHGTFKDVVKLLPRIANMGFDVIYFPPIHPIGEQKRKGKNNTLEAQPGDPGSPWAIGNQAGGHKAIHPELGTLEDFHKLISESNKHNIEIALDLALQCAPDHPYVKQHPEWFKWRPDGTVQYAENPPKKYEDILPFHFETDAWKPLWEELKSIVEYWISHGVKIFRVDNPHTKPFPFWEWMIAEVRKKNPDVLFLAEAFTRPRIMEWLGKIGFTQSYTYFTWRNTKQDLQAYMSELTKTSMKYYFRPNFWPNTPDILHPELTEGKENMHIIRLLLAATLSSNYGLYGPVYEFGICDPAPEKDEYADNEKYETKHWDWAKYTRIKEIMALINRIRKENAALQTTENIEFAETDNDQVICYVKAATNGNTLIIAVNLDPFNTQSANVKLPGSFSGTHSASYKVHDLLSGDKWDWSNEWNYVSLNPYDLPAHVFLVEN
jgi:starch synthase (maltosyl-transferring)